MSWLTGTESRYALLVSVISRDSLDRGPPVVEHAAARTAAANAMTRLVVLMHPPFAPYCRHGARLERGTRSHRHSESVKLGRVVGEDPLLHRGIRRPVREQLEQIFVAGRRRFPRRGVRPVRGPHHAIGRVLHQRPGEAADVLILW